MSIESVLLQSIAQNSLYQCLLQAYAINVSWLTVLMYKGIWQLVLYKSCWSFITMRRTYHRDETYFSSRWKLYRYGISSIIIPMQLWLWFWDISHYGTCVTMMVSLRYFPLQDLCSYEYISLRRELSDAAYGVSIRYRRRSAYWLLHWGSLWQSGQRKR